MDEMKQNNSIPDLEIVEDLSEILTHLKLTGMKIRNFIHKFPNKHTDILSHLFTVLDTIYIDLRKIVDKELKEKIGVK